MSTVYGHRGDAGPSDVVCNDLSLPKGGVRHKFTDSLRTRVLHNKEAPSEGYNAEGVFFPCGPIRRNDAVLFVREQS